MVSPLAASMLADSPTLLAPLDPTNLLADLSGNGFSGTAHGNAAPSTSGPPGQLGSYSFDGTTGTSVSFPTAACPSGPLTFEMMVQVPAEGSTMGLWIPHPVSSTGSVDLTTAGKLTFNGVTAPSALPLSSWHLVAVTMAAAASGSAIAVVIDGVQVMTGVSVNVLSPALPAIGAAASGVGVLTGNVAMMATYPTALSVARLAAHWQAAHAASRGFFDIFVSS